MDIFSVKITNYVKILLSTNLSVMILLAMIAVGTVGIAGISYCCLLRVPLTLIIGATYSLQR